MITRRQFLKLAGVAAVVPWGCARWPTVPAGVRLNDAFGTESDDRSRGDSYAIC